MGHWLMTPAAELYSGRQISTDPYGLRDALQLLEIERQKLPAGPTVLLDSQAKNVMLRSTPTGNQNVLMDLFN